MTRPRRTRSRAPRKVGRAGSAPNASGDPGPPERYRHGDVIRSEPGADAGVFYRRVTTQSVLDRYLSRSQILRNFRKSLISSRFLRFGSKRRVKTMR